MSTQAIEVVMNSLKDHKLIEWCDKNKKRCNVYWRTPEEWASLIYRYIVNNAMTNTVCTFFELTSSEEVENEGITIKSSLNFLQMLNYILLLMSSFCIPWWKHAHKSSQSPWSRQESWIDYDRNQPRSQILLAG